MNKKGFVFVESIVVLVVVAFSVAILIASYGVITRKIKEKENYDKASDKYLLYAISQLGSSDKCNYSTSIINDIDACKQLDFVATSTSCRNTKLGVLMENCEQVLKYLNIKHLYVVSNIRKEIIDLTDAQSHHVDKNPAKEIKFTNGTIEYMKTLKKCADENSYVNGVYQNANKDDATCNKPIMYMIGEFERQGTYYYASIEL